MNNLSNFPNVWFVFMEKIALRHLHFNNNYRITQKSDISINATYFWHQRMLIFCRLKPVDDNRKFCLSFTLC